MNPKLRTYLLSWLTVIVQAWLTYLWCVKGMDNAGMVMQCLAALQLLLAVSALIAVSAKGAHPSEPDLRVLYARRVVLLGCALSMALYGHHWTALVSFTGLFLIWFHKHLSEEAYRGNQAH